MAKKYENFQVGENLWRSENTYKVYTNTLLDKLVASKTIIEPNGSTGGPVSYTHLTLPTTSSV